MSRKTILITGASSGIGNATVKYFQSQGWNVGATMRKPEQCADLSELQNTKCYRLDVIKPESIQETVTNVIKDFEKVDVVLNNAGYGLIGAFELASEEQIRRQFDTNLFGLMNVTKTFLPHFRKNKNGTFVNISSIGGLVTFPLISLYHSTKWAVEGFSESLSYELNPFGIRVKLIEPGAVKTNFVTRSIDWSNGKDIADYDELTANLEIKMNDMSNSEDITSAETVAEEIYKATIDESVKIRYIVGEDAREMWKLRKEVGDIGFMNTMSKRAFDREV